MESAEDKAARLAANEYRLQVMRAAAAEVDQELRRRYEAGEAVLQLAEDLGVSKQRIAQRLHRAGCQMRNQGRPTRPARLYECRNADCRAIFRFNASGGHQSYKYCSRQCSQQAYESREQPTGEQVHFAVLDEAKVREIRRRRAAGEKVAALAKEFGITPGGVSHIVTRRTWAHVK